MTCGSLELTAATYAGAHLLAAQTLLPGRVPGNNRLKR
jgi:hypothetical protein